jgi:CubicO group peptidase (beta-lactamase class C family)
MPLTTPRVPRATTFASGLFAVLTHVATATAQGSPGQPATATWALDSVTRMRVDSVFASYDRRDTPGCALLVRRNGVTAYARGYGMGSLELNVPITPAAVMDIGSTSKQFTAIAIWMLARERKLAIDDEVQRYLPEVPRLVRGAAGRVTIRQLLQHTSGWPDYFDLLLAGGTQFESVATADDAMAVLRRQRVGSFAPGTSWWYSNTGYFLASQIVERVGGMSMRDFLRTRVFAPLGMTHTDVFDDHARLYPGRVPGYAPGPQGWRVAAVNWEQTGDGATQSSVEDLARWDANFDTPVVGDRALLDSMQQPGHLADGTPLTYAYGLFVDRFRGLRRVYHGGAMPGYQASIMRFPEQRTSIILTCNGPDWASGWMADRIAERVAVAVLGPALGPTEAERLRDSLGAVPKETGMTLQGLWWNPISTDVFRIGVRDSVAAIGYGTQGPLRPVSQLPDGWLVTTPIRDGWPRYHFDVGAMRVLVRTKVGTTTLMERVAASAPSDAAQLSLYGGHYASQAVAGTWTMDVRRDTLWLSVAGGRRVPLRPYFHDAFQSEYGVVRFMRNARGRVMGLGLTTSAMRDVRFARLSAGKGQR